ncbi:hypothetical protein [Brevundimonas sp. NPDC058933]|uniref:hypothetical protein n=1 Tax=Brevundimonas sp. NPDC058933 TaxID=3346673 RepID=UPI003BEF349A
MQVLFCQDRLRQLAESDPALPEQEAFRALLDHDMKAIHALGKQGVFEFAFKVHAGMSVPVFQQQARQRTSHLRLR